MIDRIIFNLKKTWVIDGKVVDLYEEIKSGRKTSEWRDATSFWFSRLCCKQGHSSIFTYPPSLTNCLKVHKAWFVVGYPKGNVPRLEADIIDLILHSDANQLEIQFTNVKEVIDDEEVQRSLYCSYLIAKQAETGEWRTSI